MRIAILSANWYDYRFSGDPTIPSQGWEPIPGAPAASNGLALYYRRPRLRLP
jgi:hypothetical protein